MFFILQKGNDFGEEFDELFYVMKQVMIIKLKVEEPKLTFDPPFRECRDIILRCFSEIIASGEGLPRVREMHIIQDSNIFKFRTAYTHIRIIVCSRLKLICRLNVNCFMT